jgi:hypothetical protein
LPTCQNPLTTFRCFRNAFKWSLLALFFCPFPFVPSLRCAATNSLTACALPEAFREVSFPLL